MKATIMLMLAAMLVAAALGQTASQPTRKTRKAAVKPPAITAADVQALKDAIAAQQQQLQQMQQQLQSRDAAFQQSQEQTQQQLQQAQAAAAEAQAKITALETRNSDEQQSFSKLSGDLSDIRTTVASNVVATQEGQKKVSALEAALGRFRFNGDIRIRGESFFQNYSGCNTATTLRCLDRNRARVRVRFGIDGKLNEDFIGGIAIATGSLGDPTTTNETFTNFFDRKTIGLDRGYITYNPVAHKWLSLTAGKFPYQWQRTQVTGDPDINPEGFDEKLSFDSDRPLIKNFTVQSMQLLFNENNSATVNRGHDSFMVGGQVSSKLVIGPLSTTPSVAVMNWRNTDAILQASAFAVQATTTGSAGTTPAGPFNVPGEGPGCSAVTGLPAFPPCAFAANGMTNATFVGADGKPHFASQFLYGDVIVNNVVKTGINRLPFNLLLEAEQNLRAAGHPVDRTVNALVSTSVGRQSHAYLIDASIGQVKNRHDFQVGYAFLRQEQDSVIASFAESDQRAPTNIVQNRVYALWKVTPNVVAGYTLWIGHTLNENLQHAILAPGWSSALGATEPSLKRMQYDLIYSF
jgi:Putative porin